MTNDNNSKPKSIRLSQLLSEIIELEPGQDRAVSNIKLDSRDVEPGDLFIAFGGGLAYCDEAIARGASVILHSGETICVTKSNKCLKLAIPNLRIRTGLIAARFYGFPSRWMKMIGVTGTNGKTSTTHLITQLAEQMGLKPALIGTLGFGQLHCLKESVHTTPDPITLQKTLYDFRHQGVQVVSMEVSSHALDQGRANEVLFDMGIFTNLSRDHLDYHVDMHQYANAKKKLFAHPHLRHSIVNIDDDLGRVLVREHQERYPIYGYTIQDKSLPGIEVTRATNIRCSDQGLKAFVSSPWGESEIFCPLLGRFNIYNILAALNACCLLGFDFQESAMRLAQINGISGRMQAVGGGDKPLVVVDFAHTPDALENALQGLKEHTEGRLFCVFGCGGERDRGKRPLMAKSVAHYCDRAFVTQDNPRREDGEQIISDILAGFNSSYPYTVIHNRADAIAEAISEAKPGDIVLVAGKGHEPYQLIGDKKIPFSDINQVKLHFNQQGEQVT